uniref:lysozyme n=1 Tax=Mayetiola destructor TaxID=39758 RepID=A0SLC3_MAYDE|nr:lysozyme [Mayetiola destructor]
MEITKTIVFVLLCYVAVADAKVFGRCDLVRELKKYHFEQTFLRNWVCLIENESRSDTKKINPYPIVGGTHPSGYKSYGLFQINSKDYCRSGYNGGLCNVKCEDMLDDNIAKAAQCAQMIFKLHGFKVWYGWNRKCKSHQDKLPSISDCVMAFAG